MAKFIVAVGFLLFLASSGWTAVQPDTFTLSPMVGGHFFDNDLRLENSAFWSLGLGYNFTEHVGVEAVFSQTDAEADAGTANNAMVRGLRLDTLYHFSPDMKLVPYLAAGLGVFHYNPDAGSNESHLMGNVGAGVKYFLSKNVSLRADVRYVRDFPDAENHLLSSAGVVFHFGLAPAAAAPVEVEKMAVVQQKIADLPADTDADGVADNVDRCPDTPAGGLVDAVGCPVDADADGVPDYLDQCAATPKAAPIDASGCPVDSDRDGVFDYLDRCKDTVIGASVDDDGCQTKLTLRINFANDSDLVDVRYDSEIAKAAQCINDYPGNLVYVDGHTDSYGSMDYNQNLSLRRARAVINRLNEKFGIPLQRMAARGFGETVPVADSRDPNGRWMNRRVEVICGAHR